MFDIYKSDRKLRKDNWEEWQNDMFRFGINFENLRYFEITMKLNEFDSSNFRCLEIVLSSDWLRHGRRHVHESARFLQVLRRCQTKISKSTWPWFIASKFILFSWIWRLAEEVDIPDPLKWSTYYEFTCDCRVVYR